MPDVRGTLLAKAKARLLRQPLRTRVIWTDGAARRASRGRGRARRLPSGTLSAYDRVKLVVARANGRLKKARAGDAVAPRPLGGLRDPDARAGDDLDLAARAAEARTAARRAAVRRARA